MCYYPCPPRAFIIKDRDRAQGTGHWALGGLGGLGRIGRNGRKKKGEGMPPGPRMSFGMGIGSPIAFGVATNNHTPPPGGVSVPKPRNSRLLESFGSNSFPEPSP